VCIYLWYMRRTLSAFSGLRLHLGIMGRRTSRHFLVSFVCSRLCLEMKQHCYRTQSTFTLPLFVMMLYGCSKDTRQSLSYVALFSPTQTHRLQARSSHPARNIFLGWLSLWPRASLYLHCSCFSRCFVDVIGTCDSIFLTTKCRLKPIPSVHIVSSFCVCRGDRIRVRQNQALTSRKHAIVFRRASAWCVGPAHAKVRVL
jgi:hypothetical protein